MAAQKTAQFVLQLVKMIEIVVQKIVTVWKLINVFFTFEESLFDQLHP